MVEMTVDTRLSFPPHPHEMRASLRLRLYVPLKILGELTRIETCADGYEVMLISVSCSG